MIAIRSLYVILGIRNPFVVLVRSRIALELGVVVPIPIFCCAYIWRDKREITMGRNKFFIYGGIRFYEKWMLLNLVR